jgi:hypothetical protein
MLRFWLVAATVAMGTALAGCSGSMPDWLTPGPSTPPAQALSFESEPPGADVRTAQGQTCRTPCSLAVPMASQAVTFAMNGYMPQTVPVEVRQSADRSLLNWSPPPEFSPNPVTAELQAVPPPTPVATLKPRKTAARTKTAARSAAPQRAPTSAPVQSSPFPAPPPMPPSDPAFPPQPPSTQ